MLGAYGDGAKPRLEMPTDDGITAIGLGDGDAAENVTDDWRFVDLDFVGTPGVSGVPVDVAGTADRILILRVDVTGCERAVAQGGALLEWVDQEPHSGWVIADGAYEDFDGTSVFGLAQVDSAFLGNRVIDNVGEHGIRVFFSQRSVYAHNYVEASAATKSELKFHGGVWNGHGNASSYQVEQWTEHNVIASNHFRSQESTWMVTVGPEDNHTEQRHREFVVDSNFFESGPSTQIALYVGCGLDGVLRNNVFLDESDTLRYAMAITQRVAEPDPDQAPPPGPARIDVLHNSLWSGSADDCTIVHLSTDTSECTVDGNLGSAPRSREALDVEDSGKANALLDNLMTNDVGFSEDPPSEPAGFVLDPRSGSFAAMQPSVIEDFAGSAGEVEVPAHRGAFAFSE